MQFIRCLKNYGCLFTLIYLKENEAFHIYFIFPIKLNLNVHATLGSLGPRTGLRVKENWVIICLATQNIT